MKRFALYLGITSALVASCSLQEKDFDSPQQDDVVFYASFEQPAEETRVYANENLLLRWTADDRVSIFNKITYNQEYRFIGQTGDYEGGFNKVDDPEFMTGSEITHVVSVYPFQRQTRVSENEVITVSLPAEQSYEQNSFGLGANTMVSVSSGNLLQYKTVGGFLVVNLYGKDVSVSSITLKGNNGEILAGDATVTMPLNGTPSAAISDNATTEITLTCATPVQVGASAEESTQFWFVIPPVTFSKGFTITVREYTGEVIEKSTGKSITIDRNKLSKMSPIEVERRIVLSKNAFNVPGDGGIFTLEIIAPSAPIIGDVPGWVTYSFTSYSNEYYAYRFTIDRNASSEPRTASVVVSANGVPDESFTISQESVVIGGELIKRSDWSIQYLGRENRAYDDGTNAVLEKFQLNCPGAVNLFPLIISPDDLKNVYKNSLRDFFDYEVDLLQMDAKANPATPLADLGVYSAKQTNVWFNRHMHGTWLLYVPELDSRLNLTGKYAEYEFTIQEETPTEAFKRWIGTYHVVGPNGYCAFDIVVSDADANYLYYVDGWETGPSVGQQMDGERDWIYAHFDVDRLVFYAQFLQTEDYNGTTVDEVFAGTYLSASSDAIGDLDWEGVDYEDNLAYTVYEEDKLVLKPWTIRLDNGYTFTYASMRYSRLWFTDNGNTANWAFYNTAGVPSLPAEMTLIPGTRASASGSTHIVRQRTTTKNSIHQSQRRARKIDYNNVAGKGSTRPQSSIKK